MRGLMVLAYFACIPLANWMIGHVGACVPHGPCLVPVAPGISAPSGVFVIGIALVLRDLVQRFYGLSVVLMAVLGGALLSWALADPHIALASGAAFLVGELTDCLVYTPLQRRSLLAAVAVSATIGSALDSATFLQIAFGSLDFIAGQMIGKTIAVLLSLPFVALSRKMVTA